MSNQEKVEHDYRLHGDSMQEVYPPEYQQFLDSIPETQISELDDWMELINSDLKRVF